VFNFSLNGFIEPLPSNQLYRLVGGICEVSH
jgi:hypothetical protein